jgi:pyruvate dehydrogenase E2 component (dihydrolipoamide acetyltransferase)
MTINITMPALSPTMTEGNLAKWLKAEGDTVEAGDVIAEIETDKATMEVEAVDEGVLGKIIVAEGTEGVAVNSVIAVLLEEGETNDNIVIPTESGKAAVAEESKMKPDPSTNARDDSKEASQNDTTMMSSRRTLGSGDSQENNPIPHQVRDDNSGNRIFASPLARRIAADKGIDLSTVKGSGPKGRIVKVDVEMHRVSESGKPETQNVSIGENTVMTLKNNNIKKVTAKRLLESKTTIPHFYLSVDCMLDDLLAARKDINEKADGAYKLSVNDFIIKAAAMALKAYPAANVSWTDEAVLQYENADVSVAVSTPNGLITPIVKAAELKGLRTISNEVKDLAGRAREGKLKPEEFQGGTFTVSNLGMFGIKEFSAIINPPQSCILAIGAGEQRAVVVNGAVEIKTVMTVTLSVDHRSVDGTVGAEYLQYFKRFIENPVQMLV